MRFAQRLQGFGFFHGVEVFPLQVFHEGHGHGFLVGVLRDDDGHFRETGHAGRSPAAFTGHDFVALRHAGQQAHQKRLNDALISDGRRQLAEGVVVEVFAGLILAGHKLRERQLSGFFAAVFHGGAEQGAESATESAFGYVHGVSVHRSLFRG